MLASLRAQPWLRGQPEPPPGPLLSRFKALGGIDQGRLVAGPWGDVSSDLHQLLGVFAKGDIQKTQRGRVGGVSDAKKTQLFPQKVILLATI